MKRKLALKRLSESDLTLFEHHYRNTSGAKQKAINLDIAVFINLLFPLLPSRLDENRDRVFLGLDIYGPGGAGLHNITRKILKQQKNWRLNGELISNRPEEPGRYDSLEKGDYAIMDFAGDAEPHAVKIYLVAGSLPEDAMLHKALEEKFGAMFSTRKGMERIDPEGLASVLNGLNLPDGHPVLDFIDSDVLEDASQGGLEGLRSLRKRRKNRGVSKEELGRAKLAADRIGRLGEELLNGWFELEKEGGNITSFEWVSKDNAISPYDFELIDLKGEARKIDAKSTAGDFSNPVHVSIAELMEMAQGDVSYDIYRLYSVKETSARLRIARNLKAKATEILAPFESLPAGVTVDSVSIKPDVLSFEKEISINLEEDDK